MWAPKHGTRSGAAPPRSSPSLAIARSVGSSGSDGGLTGATKHRTPPVGRGRRLVAPLPPSPPSSQKAVSATVLTSSHKGRLICARGTSPLARFCYRSSAEEMWFGSAMLLRTSSGGGIELPPVGRAWATALPVAGGALKCSATPPIPGAQLSLLVVSSSRRVGYYRLSFLQAVAGRQSPFCRPLARSLPYRSVAARGQAPLKGGQRYFHFLYGCLPPLLTSGCSHPINQQRHFLTSWRCFQGIFHFLSATATISASP